MKKKKRKGNIMVVIAMILLIFPAVLILTNMGGDSLRILVRNKVYHQELLMEDSLKLATKEALVAELRELTFPMSRDSIKVGGVITYGNYYVPPFTTIEIDGMIDRLKNKESLYTVFEVDSLEINDLTYDDNLTTTLKKEPPFQHMMNISCQLNVEKDKKTFKYFVNMNVVFNLNSNHIDELAYIANINVIDMEIKYLE